MQSRFHLCWPWAAAVAVKLVQVWFQNHQIIPVSQAALPLHWCTLIHPIWLQQQSKACSWNTSTHSFSDWTKEQKAHQLLERAQEQYEYFINTLTASLMRILRACKSYVSLTRCWIIWALFERHLGSRSVPITSRVSCLFQRELSES